MFFFFNMSLLYNNTPVTSRLTPNIYFNISGKKENEKSAVSV